jgi:peptide/nickel transport system substrate-binding protein
MLSDYVVSSSVTYTRNPNYWGVDPIHPENQLPYMDGLKELIITDASTQQAAFRTGKIDRLTGVQTDDWKLFMSANPDLVYSEGFPGVPSFPCGKIDDEGLPFKDVRVRQAMNLAVDQKDILDNYYGGYGTILAYPFLPTPPFSKGFVPLDEMPESVQELFEYKPEKAKELLAEAGYPDGFRTEIYIGTNQADLLSIIKEYLAAANINLELVVGDDSTVAAAVKGRRFNEMAMSMTYPFAFYKMHECRADSASNASHYSSEETTAVYNTILANLGRDDDAIMQAVKGVVPKILGDSWGIWLPQPYYYTIWWPWLQNYHGESNFGSTVPAEERIWLWYDTDMKKTMGY